MLAGDADVVKKVHGPEGPYSETSMTLSGRLRRAACDW